MSRENIEIVQRILDAANRRDSASTLEFYDPALVWDHTRGPLREVMGGGEVYHGHDGLRRWFGDVYEVWEDVEAHVLEMIEAGDQVISVIDYRARGRASGAQVEMSRMAGLWTIRAGKVVEAAWFRTRGEALEAAGLGESRENVEIVRRLFEAIGRRDLSSLVELTDPEIEWRSFFAEVGVGAGEYHGVEGLRQYVSDLSEAWEYLEPEVERVLDVGSVVIGVGRIRFRGRGSGAASESRAGWMFKFRDGRVLRFRAFRDPESALEAVGLRE